ncbi:MAG: radical SAM protein [Nitrospirae bacterium]|nr:radical SAM protein [Nitrospirota bacterium]
MNIKNLKTFTELGYYLAKAKLTKKRIPAVASIYITNLCNLRCKYCFVVNDKFPSETLKSELSKSEVFEIVDELYGMGTRMMYLLGGEPLVHKDIGSIVDYIVHKGMYLHIVSNGTLLEKKIRDIRRVHGICVSLDGIGDDNDIIRGNNVFEKALSGIKASLNANIPTRIHAVLTRHNLYTFRSLAELSKKIGIQLTISPPNYLGKCDIPEISFTNEEYKEFWLSYLKLKKEGFTIGNSYEAILKCLNWPKDYHEYIKIGETFKYYKPVFCADGYTYLNIHPDGTMYNCIQLTEPNAGPNIKEVGVKKAFERLIEWRPDCVSCSNMNAIEKSLMNNLNINTILSGLLFHLK